MLDQLQRGESGGINGFTQSYISFGAHVNPDGSIVWREWCPGAQQLRLYGDFSK